MHPMAAAAGAFLKTLAIEPPIKPGTPDPYTPPQPGELVPQEHLQIGPITQFVTTLHHPNGREHDVAAAPARARAEPSAGRMSGARPTGCQRTRRKARRDTELCILLACFRGAKSAARARKDAR